MLLNFTTAGGRIFTVEAEETGITFNYSQMQNVQSGRGFMWQQITGHDELYYAKDGWSSEWYGSVNVQDINTLIHTYHIGESNVITMSVNPDEQFYGKDAEQNIDGVVMFTNDNSNFKFSFFTRLEYIAGEQVSVAHCGGFFLVNPYGYSGTTQIGLNANPCQNMYKYETDADKIPAMSFWILTMHDDIQSSATYGEDFEILMVCVRGGVLGGGASYYDVFNFYDMRLFKGVDIRTPSKSTTRGNSPTGWTGGRSDRSDSDTESHIGTALRMANTTTYGLHFYRLQQQHLEWFMECLWSDTFWDNVKRSSWNPLRGVISLHNLPVSLNVGNETVITVCGKKCVTPTMHHGATACYAFPVTDDKWEGSTKNLIPAEYSGSFLDWSMTKAKVRLPFIGIVPIDISLIMTSDGYNGGLYVKYNIDCITGNCLAQIYVRPQNMGDNGDGGCLMMIGQYSGNCAYKHTISTSDFGGGTAFGSIVSAVANVGIGAITSAASGNPLPLAIGAVSGVKNLTSAATAQYNNQVQTATPNADCMGMLVPALIIERPIDITPVDEQGRATRYQNYVGRPAASGGKVKDYKVGYADGQVFIQGILHADTLYATESEKKEIEAGFAKGMYV